MKSQKSNLSVESEICGSPFQKWDSNIEPKQILQMMKKLSLALSNEQKINLLEYLLNCISLGHFESLRLAAHLHSACQKTSDCCDFVTWLPLELILRIFSYLPGKSLANCALVNRAWLQVARHPELYRRLCLLSEWSSPIISKSVSPADIMIPDNEYQQLSDFSMLDVDWFSVFRKRACLRRNFKLGKHRIRKFSGHLGAVYCVDCDAHRIVSGSADATIRVWNIRTNAEWSVQTLHGHSDAVRCVQLISKSSCHCIHESVASTPCMLCRVGTISSNTKLSEPPEALLISGSADTTVKIWRLSSSSHWSRITCTHTLQGHTDTVRCLQADSSKVISGSYDCTLRLWDPSSGRLQRLFRGHSAGITCLVYDNQFLCSGSLDNTVRVWNIRSGICMYILIRSLSLSDSQVWLTPASSIHLDYPRNRLLISHHDGKVLAWSFPDSASFEDGKLCLDSLVEYDDLEPCSTYLTEHLCVNNSQPRTVVRCLTGDAWHIICGADDKTLKVWRADNNKFVLSLYGHDDGVTCAVVSGSVIVSGSYDKNVILYDFDVN